ncbi:carbamoyltransferase [Candidatus Fermentibacteria bacterium]|nr:MAG: carbamoyltransferase [Candidatus Fermentibacteria bacterium]
MTAILGLNCYKHDAAAALIVDGVLRGAAEEERFTRKKHDADYPAKAVRFLLKSSGLEPSDIDHVAFYMVPRQIRKESFKTWPMYRAQKGALRFLAGQLAGAKKMAGVPQIMREHLGSSFNPVFHFVDHHRAHAWSAWLGAGCRNAAVLTMDGAGERHSSLTGDIGSGGITEYSRTPLPHSPGLYYSAVTAYLGFTPDNDEYKVMGLSSYGQPEFLDLFREIIQGKNGKFLVNFKLLDVSRGVHNARFSGQVRDVIGPPRLQVEKDPNERHANIACSAQRALEEAGMSVARFLRKRSENDLLVIAGGTGLNCVMNGLFERESGFAEVAPFPASNDAGTSVGAAAAVHRKVCSGIPLEPVQSMYLGPGYTEAEITADIEMAKLNPSKPDNLARQVASMIAEGKVVALFQGRMEFGPRALGNRSILADPRRPEMKDIVNSVVKHREGFRPFAPVCLEEDAGRYFEGCASSPYMIKTYPVVKGMGEVIPAVTHVDNTARVQTVSCRQNPFYFHVIEEFSAITGVSVLLNTSFNIRGEPVVNTPVDAVRCFYGTGIDALAMPPYLFLKKD